MKKLFKKKHLYLEKFYTERFMILPITKSQTTNELKYILERLKDVWSEKKISRRPEAV